MAASFLLVRVQMIRECASAVFRPGAYSQAIATDARLDAPPSPVVGPKLCRVGSG
jgi:hypothetical protein